MWANASQTGLKRHVLPLIAAGGLLAGPGCLRIRSDPMEVKPVEIKPIHITLDINVKVDRELDSFFSDIDAKAKVTKPADSAGNSK